MENNSEQKQRNLKVDIAKLSRILKELEGIRYIDWERLKDCVDLQFEDIRNDNVLTVNKNIIECRLFCKLPD